MLNYLKSNDDVIACEIRGGLDHDELLELADRIDRATDREGQTHLFVAIDDVEGIDWSAVGEYLPRAVALLGKLRRFGRVAVVSDDGWVRGWTRLESALLPGISYEVYHSAERQRALDWVEGRKQSPHDPALRIIETEDPRVIAFAIDGWLTTEAIDEAINEMAPILDREKGKVRVLARVGELQFNSFKPFLNRRYIAFKMNALKRVDRYALVGGPDWLRILTESMSPMFPFAIRHFEPDSEEEAWTWLEARPAGRLGKASVAKADAEA